RDFNSCPHFVRLNANVQILDRTRCPSLRAGRVALREQSEFCFYRCCGLTSASAFYRWLSAPDATQRHSCYRFALNPPVPRSPRSPRSSTQRPYGVSARRRRRAELGSAPRRSRLPAAADPDPCAVRPLRGGGGSQLSGPAGLVPAGGPGSSGAAAAAAHRRPDREQRRPDREQRRPDREDAAALHLRAALLPQVRFRGPLFCLSLIYAFLTRGRAIPLTIVLSATTFCSLNGFLQGHHLLHCARFQHTWLRDARLAAGFLLFVVGMIINLHSDHILRGLRRPGETVYRIPRGGMFEFVSGANFLGEILEWGGYALASWSLPATAFAFFTACSIGPRAYQHHRDYQQRFGDYPRHRKALIPFIL
uniref:3-oxo-5alpha-steroid 4-dehydrogenase (NADP(+)) n=1 Tax=Gasterosteus aculeatus aculeatus TaxID=481459 RepID=G3Q8T1_GASAC